MMELPYAPVTPFMSPKTVEPPGIAPLDEGDWIWIDQAYDAQMAYRDQLLDARRKTVLQGDGSAAAAECLDLVLAEVASRDGFQLDQTSRRPDGTAITIDRRAPLETLGRLVQEDFLILEKPEGGAEHVLTGGILCFPSRWSLQEKMGRPLIGVHARVPRYEAELSRRVQRMFDTLRPGRPLWRANWLVHATPELYQPVEEAAKFGRERREDGRFWLRVERQCLIALPQTGAAVFSVKTFVTPLSALTPAQLTGLGAALDGRADDMRVYQGGLAFHDAARAAVAAQLTAAAPE